MPVRWASVPFTYRDEVLEELAAHGLRPGDESPPQLLRDALRDLYKYEIKVLRSRFLAGHFPKHDFAAKVIELRRRYPLLSVPIELWTSTDPD